jgi:predicted outer membrane repeat protein
VSGTIFLSRELDLDKSITINGAGITIARGPDDTTPQFRIFEVEPTKSCGMRDLTISGGHAVAGQYGGGIENEGSLLLNNVAISGNQSAVGGGGIDNKDNLELVGCTVSSNSTEGRGGGIRNQGTVKLNGTDFLNNQAGLGGGGIYCYDMTDLRIINDCDFIGNGTGTDNGGAIYNLGYMEMTGGTFTHNSASGGLGGGVYSEGTTIITSVSFASNNAAKGGGVYVGAGTMTLNSCDFTGNSASVGPGGSWKPGFAPILNNCTGHDVFEQDGSG